MKKKHFATNVFVENLMSFAVISTFKKEIFEKIHIYTEINLNRLSETQLHVIKKGI